MDVKLLKGARVQRYSSCTLLYCVVSAFNFYILWFSRVQADTLCTLAPLIQFAKADRQAMPERPGNPPVFSPCRPDSAGQALRRREPSPPAKARFAAHSARENFFFCDLTKPPQLVVSYRNPPLPGGQAVHSSDVVGRRVSGLTPVPTLGGTL